MSVYEDEDSPMEDVARQIRYCHEAIDKLPDLTVLHEPLDDLQKRVGYCEMSLERIADAMEKLVGIFEEERD